ncbi:MAG: hypothetical protein WKF75_07045 [Singulisphaera sp.]
MIDDLTEPSPRRRAPGLPQQAASPPGSPHWPPPPRRQPPAHPARHCRRSGWVRTSHPADRRRQYGYSHFNKHFDRHLAEWHTPSGPRTAKRCEACGINTWQNSYAERTRRPGPLPRGGRDDALCLGKPDWDRHPERRRRRQAQADRHRARGLAERLHRQSMACSPTCRRIRDQGVLVGLSAHDPRLIEVAEERAQDVDYYAASLLTRPRRDPQAARR